MQCGARVLVFSSLLLQLLLAVASCGQVETTEAGASNGPARNDGFVDTRPGVPWTPDPQRKLGSVSVAIGQEYDLGPATFHALALFQDQTKSPPETRGIDWEATDCRKHVVDECEMIWCIVKDAPKLEDIVMPRNLLAGTITVTRTNGEQITLEANDSNGYGGSAGNPGPVRYQEMVTVSVSGGDDVPAFTEMIELEGPRWLTTREVEVAKGEDAEIGFGGSTDGKNVLVASIDGPRVRLTCRFDAAAGKGRIPGALLALLPADSVHFFLASEPKARQIGDWRIFFGGGYGGTITGSGSEYAVTVKRRD